MTVEQLMSAASVIPVLTVGDRADSAPLAKALAAGGLRVIEMTMRTADALTIMAEMKQASPELIVGMGTLRTADDVGAAVRAGADFLVSPGLTPELVPALLDAGIPCLPGVATASEAMAAAALGFSGLKFFPAEPAGGIDYLKALHGPLPDIHFCPTGGISAEKARDYLALPNVGCVGGSWIAPGKLVSAGAWDDITANARLAESLKSG
ncbi:bifunctional 4-hydroxy-2-oxoglutarate aldolase/2-dehydro-3-deoxy-phosphogluconate aldolase [Hyphobacterium sp. HN65]|uniref:Bifunctional 4-hydroxy-2-oxoglutarate aldolase/2-dehydro-3-deoxy-phosphogluconate aldolase n=1 Tax=Hyphobacterium lacteum TaxID=3116575 RepID=A0ABU7LSD2_9PROT|nr:bifunctional 4-hydroxy-2-oxoglutarate aldolase/2-dehydro-3-deoxy-phosphogluconate aldolase [Hyphobacterium sp. HN65]MEE2526826.1 bifunctional 4-hydroxy-2-oxoglutarate aldolase/2-dehydro-3-deoxy-phosphogluconate aldolase [Hyphobacterium sp. HN65]